MGWIGVVITVLLLIMVGISWHFSNIVIYPKTRSPENSYAYMVGEGHLDPAAFNALSKEEIRIQSPGGYSLFGLYVPNGGAAQTVILAHGITATLYHSIKYLWPFRQRGFNVLLIEHRNHGRSGGDTTTYGYYEKHDMKAWVDYVKARNGEDAVVGLHGESMGAAIVLQYAAIDRRVAFVVADCPFASAQEEFTYRLNADYHLPGLIMIPLAGWITKIRTGFKYSDAAPVEAVRDMKIPVLFIHGAEDTYIPPSASQTLYEAKPDPKYLWLVPGARHADAWATDPEQYDIHIGEFLAENGFV
jgi:fermentation-respiration switch protein FrsA (DUF1100 family)